MAIITRFDPFRDLARLQEEMGRLFDERTPQPAESIGWTPACDVFEDADELPAPPRRSRPTRLPAGHHPELPRPRR